MLVELEPGPLSLSFNFFLFNTFILCRRRPHYRRESTHYRQTCQRHVNRRVSVWDQCLLCSRVWRRSNNDSRRRRNIADTWRGNSRLERWLFNLIHIKLVEAVYYFAPWSAGIVLPNFMYICECVCPQLHVLSITPKVLKIWT